MARTDAISRRDTQNRRLVRSRLFTILIGLAGVTILLQAVWVAADRTAMLPEKPVELAEVVRDAVTAAEAHGDAAGVRIKLRINEPEASGFLISAGSRPALLRASNALIDNAVSHARAQVDVVLYARSGYIDLEVSDDGRELTPTRCRGYSIASQACAPTAPTRPMASAGPMDPTATGARRLYAGTTGSDSPSSVM